MGKKIVLDGNAFSTQEEFALEATRKLTRGIEWLDYENPRPLNLDALDDLLRGGFIVFDEEDQVDIEWINSEKSRDDLGRAETLKYLNSKLDSCHPSAIPDVKEKILLLEKGEGQTLFDEIIDIIREHSNIELRLN